MWWCYSGSHGDSRSAPGCGGVSEVVMVIALIVKMLLKKVKGKRKSGFFTALCCSAPEHSSDSFFFIYFFYILSLLRPTGFKHCRILFLLHNFSYDLQVPDI